MPLGYDERMQAKYDVKKRHCDCVWDKRARSEITRGVTDRVEHMMPAVMADTGAVIDPGCNGCAFCVGG